VTSNINFEAINQNFPVAGQDNDTQVFRDNFSQIKTNFSEAKTEIEDLQDNAARTDGDNDFFYNTILSATLQDVYLRKKDYGAPLTVLTQEVSFKESLHHIIRFGNNCSLTFIEFPTAAVNENGIGQLGKCTLELYGDGTSRAITFNSSGGAVFKRSSNFPLSLVVSSTSDPIIIEVWQHSDDKIFLNYLGSFV
jgi:hypothetical protein